MNIDNVYDLFLSNYFAPPTRSGTLVISDSLYREIQKEELTNQITVLESQENRLTTAIDDIRAKIEDVKQQIADLDKAG